MTFNGDRNVFVEGDFSLSPDSSRRTAIGIDGGGPSSDNSRNVAIGIDCSGPSSNSNSNAAIGIDGVDGLRAPSFEGPRAPSFEGPWAPSFEGPWAPSFEGPRAPRFEGFRATTDVNNVQGSRAENIIYGDGVEIEIVREVLNEPQLPENPGVAEPEFMEVVIDDNVTNDIEEYTNAEIEKLNAIVNESYDNFCKRVKQKKSPKLKTRFNKEKKNAKDQIEQLEKEQSERRERINNDNIDVQMGQPILMSAMIDINRINADEMVLNNESELVAQVDESFEDYCKRTKKKASKKLKAKWEKDKMSAEEQIAKNEREREKRRALKAAQSEKERKRKREEARDLRNINLDNEGRNVKQRRLEIVRDNMAINRENENDEERLARLNSQREIQNRLRENESDEERLARLALQRELQSQMRENESDEERLARLALQRELQSQMRENESDQERLARLALQRELQSQMRENESDEERLARLALQRELQSQMRENESDQERLARLALQRELQSQMRENETEEEYEARLNLQREIQNRLRENESEEERNARLASQRELQTELRENENEEERAERLEGMREAYYERQQNPPGEFSAANVENVEPFRTGEMDIECSKCNALHFKGETRQASGAYDSCCNGGKVKLNIGPYPEDLKRLMKREEGTDWREFEKNSLKYNTSMSFAYTKGEMRQLPGIFHYRIQGEMMHVMPRYTDPLPGHNPAFGQLWVLETNDAVEYRCQAPFASTCSREMFEFLHQIIENNNKYAEIYKMLYQVEDEERANAEREGRDAKICKIIFKKSTENTSDVNAMPTVNEVAGIYVCDENGDVPFSDIEVQRKCNEGERPKAEKISRYSEHVEPLTFVLFYPYGTGDFWFYNKPKNVDNPGLGKMTALQYFLYKLSRRRENEDGENFNPLLFGGKLLCKYLVMAYMIVDNERIKYIRSHQKEFRVESYGGLRDYLNNYERRNDVTIGKKVVLPSTYLMGPRNQSETWHDSMASVQKNGTPHLFITMTCNPGHPDIVNNLYENQKACDRPDLVDMVFDLQVKDFIAQMKSGRFGKVKCFTYVTEMQKRGLPHIHSLWTFEEGWNDIEKINRFISAEFPDAVIDPEGFDLVLKNMVHRPCGRYDPNAMCMQNGKCKRGFLKEFCDNTELDENSYPKYRRRDDGRTGVIKFKGQDFTVDNRSVVPYNMFLLKRYQCHINVEVVCSLNSVNYLYKYLFKGSASIDIEIRANNEGVYDEVQSFLNARYMCAHEAYHRLRKFNMHFCSESIERLQVHLDERQTVTLPVDATEADIVRAMLKKSKLYALFELNAENPNGINKNLTYLEVCYQFTWHQNECKWKPRGKSSKPKCPRMYAVNPKNTELFYLRKLLSIVKGPTGYEDLKRDPTDPNIIYETFREACVARGLVESDQMYIDAMEEGSYHNMPIQLRGLFARIVAHCDVEDPLVLWELFRKRMIGDLLQRCFGNEDLAEEFAMRYVLRMIINNERNLEDYPILQEIANLVGIEEEDINVALHRQRGDEMRETLNDEQREAYEAVMQKVENVNDTPGCFFVDGPGGTGKSYLFNCLFSNLIGKGKKVIVMAWSGIAASLYETGRTCHNVFKLDFPFGDESNSGVNPSDELGKSLKEVDVIIWDEAPMAPRHSLEVIDKKLREIMDNDIPFGGKVLVLGGDYRQLPPVVKNGIRSDIVRSSIKTSQLWELFTPNTFTLKKNERADNDSGEFAKEILKIGDGSANDNEGKVKLPDECITEDDLVEHLFHEVINANDYGAFASRAIIATLNSDVDEYNEKVIDMLDPETEKVYQAIDRVEAIGGEGQSFAYAPEHFESIRPSGFPAYNLRLRENTVVMLMRNLSIKEGLCNGTRLLVKKLERNIIIAEKLTNVKEGEDPIVMIPRITLLDDSSLYHVYRKQFPIRPAFALTVHKAQGQTFDEIGIDISKGVYVHGHLYVAISRTKAWNRLKIKLPNDEDNRTRNIVYSELLDINPLENLPQERNLNPDFILSAEENVEDEAMDIDEVNDMQFQQLLADANILNEAENYGSDDDTELLSVYED